MIYSCYKTSLWRPATQQAPLYGRFRLYCSRTSTLQRYGFVPGRWQLAAQDLHNPQVLVIVPYEQSAEYSYAYSLAKVPVPKLARVPTGLDAALFDQ